MLVAWYVQVEPSKHGADVAVSTQYSPVEFIVVVVCLPPEVGPDEQQREGEKEDDRPQQLPLYFDKKKKTHT